MTPNKQKMGNAYIKTDDSSQGIMEESQSIKKLATAEMM